MTGGGAGRAFSGSPSFPIHPSIPHHRPLFKKKQHSGRRLFSEALAAGSAEAFFPLVEQFRTQDEPAFCGLASLAMVSESERVKKERERFLFFHPSLSILTTQPPSFSLSKKKKKKKKGPQRPGHRPAPAVEGPLALLC
jgi:hypothetical protein